MNLRDFNYLIAVADYKHFGKAATACFVSQPALSMQIKKLESELGVQLFERTNKLVIVTPVGQEIISLARKLQQNANEIKLIAQTSHNPLMGAIKLAAFPTLAPYFFPQVLPFINKALPDLKLFLVEEKTDLLLQQVKQGTIDACFLALPITDDSLDIYPIFVDPFLLAVPKTHALAKKKQVKQSDIVGEKLLLLADGHCLREQALSICNLVGASEHHDFWATSIETLRQMVAQGVAITLIPKSAQKKDDGVSYIPFAKPTPSRSIALVWRKTSARRECFKKIAEIVKGNYQKL